MARRLCSGLHSTSTQTRERFACGARHLHLGTDLPEPLEAGGCRGGPLLEGLQSGVDVGVGAASVLARVEPCEWVACS